MKLENGGIFFENFLKKYICPAFLTSISFHHSLKNWEEDLFLEFRPLRMASSCARELHQIPN